MTHFEEFRVLSFELLNVECRTSPVDLSPTYQTHFFGILRVFTSKRETQAKTQTATEVTIEPSGVQASVGNVLCGTSQRN